MLLTSSGSRPLSFPFGRCTVGAMVLLLQFVFLAGVANEAPFISRIRAHFALAVVAPRLSRAATVGAFGRTAPNALCPSGPRLLCFGCYLALNTIITVHLRSGI